MPKIMLNCGSNGQSRLGGPFIRRGRNKSIKASVRTVDDGYDDDDDDDDNGSVI
jgi:hypothetical protein